VKCIAFSSEELPNGFDDRARLSAWRDFLAEIYGPHEISSPPDRPFSQSLRGTRFDDNQTPVDVLRFLGTSDRMLWNSRGQAAPRSAHLVLCFNRQAAPLSLTQMGREALFDSETAVIASCTEAGEIRARCPHDFSAIAIDQARLRQLVDDVEDLVARPLPSNGPALRHLRRYLAILPTAEEAEENPDLLAHIGTTLIDLVALALGAERDVAELAGKRGLRAARLREIIKEVKARFADPAFSPQHIARRMGVTDRYVQDLLHESGASFTQRVLKLRLQRARAMLEDPRYDGLMVADIAGASGFNEVPYFNRCFRRQFGATPTQVRNRAK
jgi:AraC-like DNA-binding protein